MNKTVVLDVVGLTAGLIGEHTPFLSSYIKHKNITNIQPVFPALTTTAQSTYLTGKLPTAHGIVGNGWYDHQECDIKFWKQSNQLVQVQKIWELAKSIDSEFTCANLFWWYNMYSSVEYSVTPRPNYLADGRKMPDCYTQPADLRDFLQQELGVFPLFQFWGPGAGIASSTWIVDASILTEKKHNPTLTLIYLPHLDYCLQKYGPDLPLIASDLRAIDREVEKLVLFYESRQAEIIILSEYAVTPVNKVVYPNRVLRNAGYLGIRNERGLELLDAGASRAFAVADHQIAHIYVNDKSVLATLKALFSFDKNIALVLDKQQQQPYGICHERSGDLVLVSASNAWFSYYFWLDDSLAPDYARTVDIFKKPGYDPVEMFMSSKIKAVFKLLQKKLGFRYVMNVIPLNSDLIKGSHGHIPDGNTARPVLISSVRQTEELIQASDIFSVIMQSLTGDKTLK